MRFRRYSSEKWMEAKQPGEFIDTPKDDAAQEVALEIRDTGMDMREVVTWETFDAMAPLLAFVALFVIGCIVILLVRKSLIDVGFVKVVDDD